jgi:hypothetical protein
MSVQHAPETVSILQELDLGQHMLCIMSNGSIDLLVNDEQTPSLAENRISLTHEETYRLYTSLHTHFQQQEEARC